MTLKMGKNVLNLLKSPSEPDLHLPDITLVENGLMATSSGDMWKLL